MILKAENIHKYYRAGDSRLHVLRGISLQIQESEFLAIEGPSGAGKSTLLHILGGLEKPDEGNVYLRDKNIYNFNDSELSQIRNENLGFIFQLYYLIPELNLLENVALPLLIKGYGKKKAFESARDRLQSLGLGPRIQHYPNQVSGGEQQRTAIARALVTRPKILLCDEPTGNLDSQMGEEVLKLLQKVNLEKSTTVIIVSHDNEVVSWAKRRVYIKDGILSSVH